MRNIKFSVGHTATDTGTLLGKRERAALAAGRSVHATARTVCVGERTLHRWRTDPAFQDQVRELQAELLRRAVGRLSSSMPVPAMNLRKLLASESEKVQLAAASKLLENGLKLLEQLDFAERVQARERRASDPKH